MGAHPIRWPATKVRRQITSFFFVPNISAKNFSGAATCEYPNILGPLLYLKKRILFYKGT